MTEQNRLKGLLSKFIDEFFNDSDFKINDLSAFEKANIHLPNQNIQRFDQPKGYKLQSISYVNPLRLNFFIYLKIKDYPISKEIFDIITQNNLSPFDQVEYEKDLGRQPSITRNILAGVITRIYVLNGFKLTNTKNKEKAIQEALNFLYTDNISYKLLVNLHGVTGNINSIEITPEISIKKASYEIASLFQTYYYGGDIHYEMYEGDYYIEICVSFAKSDYQIYWNSERKLIENIHKVLLLSSTGNIEIGKELKMSDAFPLITTHQINSITSKINLYDDKFPFKYELDADTGTKIKTNYEILEKVNFNELEHGISESLKRLIKAKSSLSFEDRIIELALAIEYLINTKNHEVVLQICLKSIKLFNENNKDESLYKKIRDFYNLRSKVVHGANKPIKNHDHTRNQVSTMEFHINEITIKILCLNKEYSLEVINKAVDMSMYVDDTLENLLIKIKESTN